MSILEVVLQEKYRDLRIEIGSRYASMMEGYGHIVNILDTVEDFYKDCKRGVKCFVPQCSNDTKEGTLRDLTSMMNQSLMLANAALTMAAMAKLYRDTAMSISGGDLIDMIDSADDTEDEEE